MTSHENVGPGIGIQFIFKGKIIVCIFKIN